MKQYPKTGVSFSFGGFFIWLGKVLQKYIVLSVLLLIASFMIVFVADALASDWITIILAPLLYFGIGYLFFSLFLVGPLAVLRRKPVLKNSMQMIKGKKLKIFGGVLLYNIILMIVTLPFFAAINSSDKQNFILVPFVMLGMGFLMILLMASYPVYVCTVYRILKQEQTFLEQRLNDSLSFKS